ncbi:hypothetical protein PSQ40_19585 [Curvibacter sp. HBC61]|uniref:Tat pathway signal sequence n=1 Tax=Curvibacter cyanobacteriorum TaxID=3026422 RepID=A0ABT5N6R0_9BURK|nr:DUF6622 family protein [Curvibacter sp. HBC61]MDD0840788.1 hypothetical protein [Curvibacter sp. HBC61]
MLLLLLQNTPRWVFALFVALLCLGLRQTVTRQMKPSRVLLPALGLAGFSLYGVLSAWPTQPLSWLCWTALAGATATWVARAPLPAGTHYDPDLRRFTVTGSWVPLAGMMGLFLAKYTVGAALALQTAWVQDAAFPWVGSAVFGAFSGLFLGRVLRLWRLALHTDRAARAWATSTMAV